MELGHGECHGEAGAILVLTIRVSLYWKWENDFLNPSSRDSKFVQM